MQLRQMWLRDFLIENDAEPLTFVRSARLEDKPSAVGQEMRRALNLDDWWAAKVRTWQDAMDKLRETSATRKADLLGIKFRVYALTRQSN